VSIILDINPVPKPRQTRADKWKQRPSVLRYRAFADELRLKLPRDFDFNGKSIVFTLEMPKSWSKKKKAQMDATPHEQTPDLDNLLKALLDAHMSDDSCISLIGRLEKVWGYQGSIRIY
jgi:Holliday junction resolvase RusA-like endonuclease